MTQVFISYRHISPDQDLAEFLEGYLKSRGIDVFIDTQMLVGDKWVEEIESRIRASSFFVALYVGLALPVIGVGLAAEAFGLKTAGIAFSVAVAGLVGAVLASLVRR